MIVKLFGLNGEYNTMISIKKIICCISVGASLLFLTGCESRPSLYYISHEDADKIFELIKSEDISQLSELFSDEVKSEHNLEEELQKFFENIDGELLKYEKLDFSGSTEGYDKNGNLDKYSFIGEFKNISSSTEKKYYELLYYRTFVSAAYPDTEGINGIRLIINEDDDSSKFIDVGIS